MISGDDGFLGSKLYVAQRPEDLLIFDIKRKGTEHFGDERCASCIKHNSDHCLSSADPGIPTRRCTFCIAKRCPCSFSRKARASFTRSSPVPPAKRLRRTRAKSPLQSLPEFPTTKRRESPVNSERWPKEATEALLDFLDGQGTQTLSECNSSVYFTVKKAREHLSGQPHLNGQYNIKDVERHMRHLCRQFGTLKGGKADMQMFIREGRKHLNCTLSQPQVPELPSAFGFEDDSDLTSLSSSTPSPPPEDAPRITNAESRIRPPTLTNDLSPSPPSVGETTQPTVFNGQSNSYDERGDTIMVIEHVSISQALNPSPPPSTARLTPQLSSNEAFEPHYQHDRGDILPAMETINLKIHNAVIGLFSSLQSTKDLPPPDYYLIQKQHHKLFSLLQHTFGTTGQDSTVLKARLASLNLRTVAGIDAIRAIIAVAICNWVLESDFPESCSQNNRCCILRAMETRIEREGIDNLIKNMIYMIIRDPSFMTTEVQPRATELTLLLSSTLTPLLTPSQKPALIVPPKAHKEWLKNLESIFVLSLKLKAQLKLDPGQLEFYWPEPEVIFNPRRMMADSGGSLRGGRGGVRVQFGLIPGIFAHDNDGTESVEVPETVAKALVIV